MINGEKKEITVVYNEKSDHQVDFAKRFAQGMESLGVTVYLTTDHKAVKTKNVCFWGWRPNVHHVRRNKIVLERGYIGDRFHWTSIATNGLNGFGGFHYLKPDPQRFAKYFEHLYKPWNPDGNYILIIGQTPGDTSLRGKDLAPWYTNMALRCQSVFPGTPVLFRQHPNLDKRGVKQNIGFTKPSVGTLEEALEGAKLVITYNSNTAVDAILAGKPTYVEDQGSMCYSVTNHKLDAIDFQEPKNRRLFVEQLAWCQFTPDEIKDGFPMTYIPLE